MSYAIVRNEKMNRTHSQGISVHNDRRAKNHSNKNIDTSKTYLNYYLKKNDLNYVKEFDKLREENNLKGQIRENSIILCEMVFTSDKEFFDNLSDEETKRYFQECYNFACNYKSLNEKYVVSAVVHLDEGTPHMHLIYVPVIEAKDKNGNTVDKVCSREFWKGKDSYRSLQDDFYEYITGKGFKLERGVAIEETERKHHSIQEYKELTNYEQTKQMLNDTTIEIPHLPELNEIKKLQINRDEKN